MELQLFVDQNIYNIPVGDFIPITDPEQFVPLWLAYTTPVQYKNLRAVYDSVFNRVGTIGLIEEADIDAMHTDAAHRQRIKSELIQMLDHPYPKQYRLCLPAHSIMPIDGWNHESYLNNDVEACLPHPRLSFNYVFLPGMHLTGYGGNYYITTAKANQFATMSKYASFQNNYVCDYLVLVKAKCIPTIRARTFLQLPQTHELTDFRILRRSMIPDNARYTLTRTRSFDFTKRGIPEEVVDPVKMNEFLFQPFKKKDKKTLLQDAARMIEHPECLETAY